MLSGLHVWEITKYVLGGEIYMRHNYSQSGHNSSWCIVFSEILRLGWFELEISEDYL